MAVWFIKMKLVNIVQKQSLAHGYVQITFEDSFLSSAQPGHFVIAENEILCSLSSVEEHRASCIISPEDALLFERNTVLLSPLQGEVIQPPDPDLFCLLTSEISVLGSVLFYFKKYRKIFNGLVIIEGKEDFPFFPSPSQHIIPHIPSHVIASIPLLEDWGIPNRLANLEERSGCYHGTAEALAAYWLSHARILSCSQIKIPPVKLYTSA